MTQTSQTQIEQAYALAKERYADLGVDVEKALATLKTVSISLHCWQGDDVGGFENPGGALGGGLAATGNYPGKARTADVTPATPEGLDVSSVMRRLQSV